MLLGLERGLESWGQVCYTSNPLVQLFYVPSISVTLLFKPCASCSSLWVAMRPSWPIAIPTCPTGALLGRVWGT